MNIYYLLKCLSFLALEVFALRAAETVQDLHSIPQKLFMGKLSPQELQSINSNEVVKYLLDNLYIDGDTKKRNGDYLSTIEFLENKKFIEVNKRIETINFNKKEIQYSVFTKQFQVLQPEELKQYFQNLYTDIVQYNIIVQKEFADQKMIKQKPDNQEEINKLSKLESSQFNGKPETKEQSCQTEEQKQ